MSSIQSKQLTGEDFIIPIYIDTNSLLDVLASRENGFSILEKITSKTGDSKSFEQSSKFEGGGEFGPLNFLNVLKITIGNNKASKATQEDSQQSEKEKYHTYGSLLYRLRAILQSDELLKDFDGSEKSWDNISVTDFIEVHGVFRPNPLAEYLRVFERIIKLSTVLMNNSSGITGNGIITSSSTFNDPMLKQFRDIMTSVLTEIDESKKNIIVIDLFT